MMALGELGCTGTSHTFQEVEASGAQYPSHHALGFRKLAQGAFTSGRTRMVDGKQPFSSVFCAANHITTTGHKSRWCRMGEHTESIRFRMQTKDYIQDHN